MDGRRGATLRLAPPAKYSQEREEEAEAREPKHDRLLLVGRDDALDDRQPDEGGSHRIAATHEQVGQRQPPVVLGWPDKAEPTEVAASASWDPDESVAMATHARNAAKAFAGSRLTVVARYA